MQFSTLIRDLLFSTAAAVLSLLDAKALFPISKMRPTRSTFPRTVFRLGPSEVSELAALSTRLEHPAASHIPFHASDGRIYYVISQPTSASPQYPGPPATPHTSSVAVS
ncbi:hypothetical protein EDC01DRAFT_635715 [Geopyxis carbonaria]|nr:hypothetical protein EDC01DRAFT_635715 [Geopyxis carbonaria]